MQNYWKTGELSALTGLTLRTLRYYDGIGLFSPSAHTASGHRLYTPEDLSRLQRILSLKSAGLALEDIRRILGGEQDRTAEAIGMQIARLREELKSKNRLLRELEEALRTVQSRQAMSVEELTVLLGAMKAGRDEYFTKSQLRGMRSYYKSSDSASLDSAAERFAHIVRMLRVEMEKGTPADSAAVRQLAAQWREIAFAFGGDDPHMRENAERFHSENPEFSLQFGLDADLYAYITEALV
ncbi:MerR family transcriptional regulator [Saccharibacillus deserti]|uniref:MerR family transcriptional regulator n=1 Tax=Saccharibacillus deserti TaxID=1634444 RepID=UPI0015527A8D|nr:MerR family transcriptional regulator [Saccharibacillus deserti]